MANHKRSNPVGPTTLGSSTPTASRTPAGSSTSTSQGGTAGTSGPGVGAGGVLSALGLNNPGLLQVKTKTLASAKFSAKVAKRLSGVQGFLPSGSSLVFLGQTFTVASIVQVLSAVEQLFTALATAIQQSQAQVGAARTALNAELPTAHQFLTALDGSLVAFFGKGNPVLSNFGISPGKTRAPKVATLAKAQGTAELTRQARHTMGKVQKQAVTGGEATLTVTGPAGQVLQGNKPAGTAPAPADPGGGSTPAK